MRANTMTAVSVLLFALAAAMLAASGWLYWKAAPAIVNTITTGGNTGQGSCLGTASALGFEARSLPDGKVIAALAAMPQPALDFGRASTLIALCRGYRLESFCAGQGCGARAMEIRLATVGK